MEGGVDCICTVHMRAKPNQGGHCVTMAMTMMPTQMPWHSPGHPEVPRGTESEGHTRPYRTIMFVCSCGMLTVYARRAHCSCDYDC
eukprot:4591250-Pyramimonas_sp.AAC.1